MSRPKSVLCFLGMLIEIPRCSIKLGRYAPFLRPSGTGCD